MSYKLIININQEGREFLIKNQQKIIIVHAPNKDDNFSIVSASFHPFGNNNEIIFYDDFSLFVTSQKIVPFDTIKFNYKINVPLGNIYSFNGVLFSNQGNAYSENVCGLNNQSQLNNLVAGIGQKIKINNNEQNSAIRITSIPKNQTTYFAPGTVIRIFVAKGINTNMIIPTSIQKNNFNRILTPNISNITIGNYLKIDVKLTKTITYNTSTNTFQISTVK
ncbi:hypothetical protein [Tenacibaculum amylolyticum]|uniref:hypothetical protein n=1 Tax=Tenacibaculum amylolyticum TaxID=104269 RepID=UPI003892EECE